MTPFLANLNLKTYYEKVILDEIVVIYLNELVDVLVTEGYLGFRESAYDYAGWIFNKLEKDISKMPHKPAPSYFNRYGRGLLYSVFKRNNNTQWYVFFHLENDVHFIRYIAKNHTVAKHILDTD